MTGRVATRQSAASRWRANWLPGWAGRRRPQTPRPFFLAVIFLLAVIPTRVVAGLPVVCPYRNLFGVRCLGCGITRALSLLLHFHAGDALAMNPLVTLVCPWLAILAARDLADLADFVRARRNRNQRAA